MRLSAGGRALAYTGDTGPSPAIVALAEAADLFLAEASFPEQVQVESAWSWTSAEPARPAAGVGC